MTQAFSVRRRFLKGFAASALAMGLPTLRAQSSGRTPVVVLTAYPDEVVSRFEAAFEKAYPAYRLQVIWRMPHEALPYLQRPKQSGVDVYWSASPRTYAMLAQQGLLQPLGIPLDGLPDRIGKAPLREAQARYTATEMAGYGLAVNARALGERGLPVPQDWKDLADPRYAKLIALPSAARVGFAPPIVEIVLQAWGWDAGWALWSEIAGNAFLIERGSTFVTDEVSSGRHPIGVSIDFFTASAIANGAPIQFLYPPHNGINPAHIAITTSASNLAGAHAFASFVVSPEGQAILLHPDIRKLPVRPAVYAGQAATQYRPFDAAEKGAFEFDSERAQPRLALSAALFEQMLGQPHSELVALWERVHRAEREGKPVSEARRLLGTPPLDESSANAATLQEGFRMRLEGQEHPVITATEQAWAKRCTDNRARATQLLNEAQA